MSSTCRICFVMTTAYPTIKGGVGVGGAELQSWMIARKLARRHEISFIVNAPESGTEYVDGVRVIKIKSRNAVMDYLMILKKLINTRADVYYQRTGGFITAFTSLVSRMMGKRFVLNISGNCQLDKDYPYEKPWIIKKLYRLGITLSNSVIVQNSNQKSRLDKAGVYLIPSFIELDSKRYKKDDSILWVGSLYDFKKPGTYLRLARSMPEFRFLMIGEITDRNYQYIREEAKKTKNLNYLGPKPFKETEEYFKKSRVFVNTSSTEGFPNTFLQSWKYGTPVVSLNMDPDEIICRHRVGFHSRSFDNMARDVRKLMKDKKLWKEMSNNSLSYIKRHDYENIIGEYERVLVK